MLFVELLGLICAPPVGVQVGVVELAADFDRRGGGIVVVVVVDMIAVRAVSDVIKIEGVGTRHWQRQCGVRVMIIRGGFKWAGEQSGGAFFGLRVELFHSCWRVVFEWRRLGG